MNHDINVKKVRLNCYRQSKVPGEFMLQMRVPGGTVDAKYLSYVEHIAKTWGDGNFNFGRPLILQVFPMRTFRQSMTTWRLT